MNIPVIRLEIEGMKHTIMHAMAQHLVNMDADIQSAVDSFCTQENISKVVHDTAAREIKIAIESEVQNFYRYGKGREAIKAAVSATLDE